VGPVVASDRLLRWLLWTLVVLVIVSAVMQIGVSQNLFLKFPDIPNNTDLVERLATSRTFDQGAYVFTLIGSLASIGVFMLVAMLGPAIRFLAHVGSARDVMAAVFIVGGVVGIVSQLLNIGVSQAATFGYCDCGYRSQELIAQDYALGVGWTAQLWVVTGAVTLVGLGAALAGWLVEVSPTWKYLSYGIAVALVIGAVLLIAGQDQIANLVEGITAGIAVPIWAILLARSSRLRPAAEVAAT
jgi:hypothetical protein